MHDRLLEIAQPTALDHREQPVRFDKMRIDRKCHVQGFDRRQRPTHAKERLAEQEMGHRHLIPQTDRPQRRLGRGGKLLPQQLYSAEPQVRLRIVRIDRRRPLENLLRPLRLSQSQVRFADLQQQPGPLRLRFVAACSKCSTARS